MENYLTNLYLKSLERALQDKNKELQKKIEELKVRQKENQILHPSQSKEFFQENPKKEKGRQKRVFL